jgi:hypothetical protein
MIRSIVLFYRTVGFISPRPVASKRGATGARNPSVTGGKNPADRVSRSAFDVARASPPAGVPEVRRAGRPWNAMGRVPIPRHATTRPFSSSSPRLCAFALSLRLPSSLPEIRTPPRLRAYRRTDFALVGGPL